MMHNTVSLIKNHFPVILLLFFLGLATACEDQASCVSDNTNYVQVSFYKIDTTGTGNVPDTYQNVSFYTENGEPLRTQENELLLDTSLSSFPVPLNPSADQTAVILQQDNVSDTLYFTYNREQLVISPECGVEQRFYNLGISRKTLDSVRVLKADISSVNQPHVGIYTCRYTLDDTLRLSFYKFDPTDTVPPLTSNRDTINVLSVTNDRGVVLLQPADSVSGIKLPVYADAAQIGLNFTYTRLADDTVRTGSVVFGYRKTENLLISNTSCLPQTRYDQLELESKAAFDSVIFQNTSLDQNNAENARIFFE